MFSIPLVQPSEDEDRTSCTSLTTRPALALWSLPASDESRSPTRERLNLGNQKNYVSKERKSGVSYSVLDSVAGYLSHESLFLSHVCLPGP